MRPRTEMNRLEELVRLHRQGTGAREIARLLRMGPNQERAYRQILAAAGLLEGDPESLPSLGELKAAVQSARPSPQPAPSQTSTLESHRETLVCWIERGMKPRAIFDRLRLEQPELKTSHSAVKRFCRAVAKARGVRPEDVAIPVDTGPGEIAQVDFGYVGKMYDPDTKVLRKAWCFVLVLGFSRHMYARIVFDQKTETWIALHIEAFAALGGVVETVVPDNLKAAVVRAAFGIDSGSELNRSYRELARYYGFKVDPAPPRDAPKKGKVEAGVKYVKQNFMAGRAQCDVRETNAALERWIREIAGERVHGTTGRKPLTTFAEEEKTALKPLPKLPYDVVLWKSARVHRDSHAAFKERLYSVPWKLIGKRVWLRATKTTVTAHFDDELVATHDRRGPGVRSTVDAHLPDHRAELRHRSRAYWEERAARIGPEVLEFVRAVFDADDVLSQLRKVQAIVGHLEPFPPERARAACLRASTFGSFEYRTIRDILRRGLDAEPAIALPSACEPANDGARFARPTSTWTARRNREEQTHEQHR